MALDDFQNRIMKYIKYGLTIKTTFAEGKEYNLVGINYKPKWDVIKPSEESGVFCIPASGNNGVCYYFSEVSNGVGCIFDSIEETIQYNEDIERKLLLLKEKVTELKELFANESYEDLVGLVFVTSKDNKQRKSKAKKQTDKKKDAEQPQNETKQTEDETQTKGVLEEEVLPTTNVKNNTEEANEIDNKIAKVLSDEKR